MQSYNISLNTTCVWRVLRLNELQTNQKYLASSISNCKPRCLQRCNATFWPEHLTSSPWVVGNKEVVPPTWQCAATDDIIRQWIVVSASNHCVATHIIFSRFVTLYFFLLPQLKWALKGHRYADIQAIHMAMANWLYTLPESAFQDCFKDIQKYWKHYTDAEGSYFEGDS